MLAPLPPLDDFLMQYRLEARGQIRRNLVGGHVTRRIGQSLEFREYAPYTPGDDIRHVDWRATFRNHGGGAVRQADQWLLRRYESEERLQLLLSLDLRQSMYFPQQMTRSAIDYGRSKAQIAQWIASALSIIALEERDGVVLHRLFGEPMPPVEVPARAQLAPLLERLPSGLTAFNDALLEQFLPPTACWVILTDFYSTNMERLLERVRGATNWVIFVELDSWPAERAAVQSGARRIQGPDSDEKRVQITPEVLREVEQRIAAQRNRVLETCPRADHTRWVWPASDEFDPVSFFQARLAADRVLQRLFMKESI